MIDKSKLVDLSHVMYPGKEEYGLELETHEAADLYPQYEVDDGFGIYSRLCTWVLTVERISSFPIEIKGAPNQPNHQFLMEHQIPIIEFAAILDKLKSKRFTLFVLAMPVWNLDSCPVRLVGLED